VKFPVRTLKDYQESISLDILANEHCKAVSNARCLIDDATLLIRNDRFLSALDFLCLAIEELAKAHLITRAVVFDAGDVDKWQWLRLAFHN
jgi:AbiV family abortive infection protein